MTTANTKTQAESFTGNLFLIGFMGSGKSTIAAELSRMLHRPVLEMDEEIEKREGMSIPAIFSEHGEAYFRQLETDLLKETSALGGFLVSCGGGAAMREENVREINLWIHKTEKNTVSCDNSRENGSFTSYASVFFWALV